MRNIRRLRSHSAVCELLARTTHPRTGNSVFATYRDLALFAALLGFEHNRRMPLDGPSDLLVDGRILENNDLAVDLVYLLGLAATRGTEILRDDGEQPERLATLFEEYLTGGLAVLSEWLAASPGDANGDRAVLTALHAGGFLNDEQPAGDAIERVAF